MTSKKMTFTSVKMMKKLIRATNLLRLSRLSAWLNIQYDSLILFYLNNHVCKNTEHPQLLDATEAKRCNDYTIWICWLQGIENAPEIVKKCIANIKELNSNDVKVITFDNYQKYVSLPDIILTKLHRGVISNTHFSDILRFALLSEHGGLWIDSTYLTLKKLPEEISNYDFFTLTSKEKNIRKGLSKGIWTGNFMKFSSERDIPKYILNFFITYWETHNSLIDYYLIDYVIQNIYNNSSSFKERLNSLPELGKNRHLLGQILLTPITQKKNEMLANDEIKIYKLNHRTEIKNTKGTYYEKYLG